MRMLSLLVNSMVLACALSSNAHALPFAFSGSDAGGTGSAIMDISVSGPTVTAVVDNTSPLILNDGTGVNAPGITAFGFDLDPATMSLLSWDLTAHNTLGDLVTIGGSGSGTGDWILTVAGNVNGIRVDYIPNTDTGVQGALYNPNVTSGEGASPYYTRAILTMLFDDTPILNTTDSYSPMVRMQNVGLGGEGSLKLSGNPVPEPATMLLFGSGLVGVAALGRKKWYRKV